MKLRHSVQIALTCFFVAFAYGTIRSGDVRRALSFLMGQRIFIDHHLVNLGTVHNEQVLGINIKIINLSTESDTLIGVQASCACLSINENLPLPIGPREAKDISLRMKAPKQLGRPFEISTTVLTQKSGSLRPTFKVIGQTRS